MKLTITKEKRRFFLFLPLVAIPFCCLVFHVLGGGRGVAQSVAPMGLNTQLPAVAVDLQRAFQDKLKTYEQADKDSVRQAQWRRQDPYRRDSVLPARAVPGARGLTTATPYTDPRADQLVQRLNRLKQSLHPPEAMAEPERSSHPSASEGIVFRREGVAERSAPDPQLDRLNVLLDKVIRIQHPQEAATASAAAPATGLARQAEEVVPADSTVNSIAAIVQQDQTLVTGETLALRIMDSVRMDGRVVPTGELVYGTVSLNNDRLLVHIGALREGRSLYKTDWQVFDLDGLEGIHIPGVLGRDVAKQSADQGVNSLNVMNLDPSLGAQVAGAGIQAAKSFLGRKVRQVRVTVRGGYQVLLRNPRAADIVHREGLVPMVRLGRTLEPPALMPDGPTLEHCRNEGIELRLREVSIRDSCLWFGLEWRNHSPIVYSPAYFRWTIRDRRAFRRTALQEQALEPRYSPDLPVVGADSVASCFTGFRPFALPRDKQLVLEIGEKGGGRTLVLEISHKDILKAVNYAKASH